MTYSVHVLPTARDDIASVVAYVTEHSPEAAEEWLRDLLRRVAELEEMPRSFPPARERDDWGIDLRQVIFKAHRIIFDVEGDEVHVFHVRHVRQDNIPSPE